MKRDEKYMALANNQATKSKCSRLRVGAVIVKNGKIISYGYNGVPKHMKKCTIENPCFKEINNIPSGTMVDANLCMSVHAEQFAIINAGNREFIKSESNENLSGSTLYSTHQPCRICALFIIAADIRRVVYEEEYPDKVGLNFLLDAKINVEQCKNGQKKKIESKINYFSSIASEEVEVNV